MDLRFRCLVTIRYNEDILVWDGVSWIQSVEINHPYDRTDRHWRRMRRGFAISNGSRVWWALLVRSLSLVHANIRDSKTDREAAYLSHICVCDNIYIYTYTPVTVVQPATVHSFNIANVHVCLSLTPSIPITHPSSSLYTTPPHARKPSLFSSPLQYQTGTNHAASRPAGHQPGCQYLYSRVSEFHVYHFSTEFCPSSHPWCTAMWWEFVLTNIPVIANCMQYEQFSRF